MFPQLKGPLLLLDGQDREVGQVLVDRIRNGVVFGQFTPGPAFAPVERLFADYVEAANEQLLNLVGDLDREIAALRLRLQSAEVVDLPDIYDVQIGEGVITFRPRGPLADRHPGSAAPAAVPGSDTAAEPRPV